MAAASCVFISRWVPAGAGAYCRERLIRLQPGLRSGDVRIKNSNFISREFPFLIACPE
jgi:hypothetical protein